MKSCHGMELKGRGVMLWNSVTQAGSSPRVEESLSSPSGIKRSPSSPSLKADPPMSVAAVLAFPEGALLCRTRSSSRHLLPWGIKSQAHTQPGLSAPPLWFPSAFPCALGCWWCRRPGDSISILLRSPCPCGGGGEPQPAVSAPWQPEGGTLCTQECVNSVKLHKQG